MKNSNDTIEDRTRNFRVVEKWLTNCVPQMDMYKVVQI